MNDRQIVESAILPFILYQIINPLHDLQETEEELNQYRIIVKGLLEGIESPLENLLVTKQNQLRRRLIRDTDKVTNIFVGSSNSKCLVAMYYLIENLIQNNHITIYSDTNLGEALETFMESIQIFFNEERLDKSAQKTADKLLRCLNKLGYFK